MTKPKFKKGQQVWYNTYCETYDNLNIDTYEPYKEEVYSYYPDEERYLLMFGGFFYEFQLYSTKKEAVKGHIEHVKEIIKDRKKRNKEDNSYIKKVESKFL